MPKPLILVIDDNKDSREFIAASLRQLYDVETAPDGLTGFERVRALRPIVVVTDMVMPGIDGLELCRRIKADVELKDTLVMIVTGATVSDELPDGFWKMGTDADDFMQKPFAPSVLIARVQAMLEQRAGFKPLPPGLGYYEGQSNTD